MVGAIDNLLAAKLIDGDAAAPEFFRQDDAEVGLVAIGGCHAAMLEAVDRLHAQGIRADYMRIRAFPFGAEVEAFLAAHELVYVVEQNRDGQMFALLKMEMDPAISAKLRSIRHFNGLPIDARSVTDDSRSPGATASAQ